MHVLIIVHSDNAIATREIGFDAKSINDAIVITIFNYFAEMINDFNREFGENPTFAIIHLKGYGSLMITNNHILGCVKDDEGDRVLTYLAKRIEQLIDQQVNYDAYN